MSFSTEVRRELAHATCDAKCCAYAELTGALLASGGLSFKGFNHYGFVITADGADAATRFSSLLKRHLHVDCLISTIETSKLGGLLRYTVTPPDADIPMLLRELRLLDKSQLFGLRAAPAPEILRRDCCPRAFLRGAYLVSGATGDPNKAYHIEFSLPNETLAAFVQNVLARCDLPAKISERKGRAVVYIKEAEHLSDLLALMGAHEALLELENVRIYKGIRNDTNRQVNCDTANTDKTVAAAQKQLSMIAVIDKALGGIHHLPAPLYDIADLRVRYPDATMAELGEMATPAIGKSGVNARMRKLEAIAEDLINQ